MDKFKRRFYDSHPNLPLDPDPDQISFVRPIHTDWAHIAIVGAGAFFGTLARYDLGLLVPNGPDGWPTATFLINISGAFLLGMLLQSLLHQGKDEGGRRIVRLTLGTGFMGAFTTYSSLATSVALLARGDRVGLAIGYGVISVVFGIVACAVGIWMASAYNKRRDGSNA